MNPLALLARIPPDAARPGGGVILVAIVFLVVVIGINTAWELIKGPPNP